MRAPGAILALGLALGLADCASPTAITVDVYTEVSCAEGAEVSITLADSLAALATSAPSSTSTGCLAGQTGHVGSVVIAPAGDEGKLVAFAVATRDDGGATDACLATPLPSACIVARRQLRFAPHVDLSMRVDLRDACRGVTCPSDQTCVNGGCVSAVVPATCSAPCDETQLPPTSGGPAPLAAGGGPGVRLVATQTGFAAAWPTTESDGSHAVRLQALGADAKPAGALSKPIAPGSAPIADMLLGYDGARYGVAVRAAATSFVVAAADGSVVAGPATVGGASGFAAHGLPWDGSHFALMVDGPGAGAMTIDYYDSQATAASYGFMLSSGTAGTVLWDGSKYIAGTYQDVNGTCWFFYTPDAMGAAPGGGPAVPTDCAGMHLAPRAGGGYHLAYETQSTPARVSYWSVDATGTTVGGATQVSPGDGQSYGGAQVVATPKGATVFFVPSGGTTVPLYRADVDPSGKLSAPAAPVTGIAVASGSYEVVPSGAALGVAWFGRTDSAGAAATGIYATTLAP